MGMAINDKLESCIEEMSALVHQCTHFDYSVFVRGYHWRKQSRVHGVSTSYKYM